MPANSGSKNVPAFRGKEIAVLSHNPTHIIKTNEAKNPMLNAMNSFIVSRYRLLRQSRCQALEFQQTPKLSSHNRLRIGDLHVWHSIAPPSVGCLARHETRRRFAR
jgi:hypothetical protein